MSETQTLRTQLAAKDDAIWSLTQTINAMEDAYNQMERAKDAEIGRLREALDAIVHRHHLYSDKRELTAIADAALAGPDPGIPRGFDPAVRLRRGEASNVRNAEITGPDPDDAVGDAPWRTRTDPKAEGSGGAGDG